MGLDITVHKFCQHANEFLTIEDKEEWAKTPVGHLTVEKEQQYYDLNKIFEDRGLNIDDYHCYMMSGAGWAFEVYKEPFEANPNLPKGVHISREEAKYTLHGVMTTIACYEEVGYQRKGLNNKFYDDYINGKIGYWVWTKEELLRYMEEYCEDDREEEFFENIIEPFEEGVCGVSFDW